MKVLTDNQNYTAIADAIRTKGISGTFYPSEMPAAINQIVTSDRVKEWTITTTEIQRGNYTLVGFDSFIAENYNRSTAVLTMRSSSGTPLLQTIGAVGFFVGLNFNNDGISSYQLGEWYASPNWVSYAIQVPISEKVNVGGSISLDSSGNMIFHGGDNRILLPSTYTLRLSY